MANLSGFGYPVHDSWFEERTELARKNQLIMRKSRNAACTARLQRNGLEQIFTIMTKCRSDRAGRVVFLPASDDVKDNFFYI